MHREINNGVNYNEVSIILFSHIYSKMFRSPTENMGKQREIQFPEIEILPIGYRYAIVVYFFALITFGHIISLRGSILIICAYWRYTILAAISRSVWWSDTVATWEWCNKYMNISIWMVKMNRRLRVVVTFFWCCTSIIIIRTSILLQPNYQIILRFTALR